MSYEGIQSGGDHGVQSEKTVKINRALPLASGKIATATTIDVRGIPYGGQEDGLVIDHQPIQSSRADLPA